MLPMHSNVDDPSSFIEEKELVRFERADEYLSLLSSLVAPIADHSSKVAASTISQGNILSRLVGILDEYQDQANLLDPYLERIVSPPVEALQRHVRRSTQHDLISDVSQLSSDSVTRLSKLVYSYTKVRGYKTVVHYFPHEVADLPATLSFLEGLQQSLETETDGSNAGCWELRYVCLLWLSLICMIPFDLAKFDRQGHVKTTASRISAVAEYFLASPGKERDAAAVVLGRLFQRSDVKKQFPVFLQSSARALDASEPSLFHATGILQAMCEVLKTSEPAFVIQHLDFIQNIVDACDSSRNTALANDGLITKYKTKLTSRLALKLLRPRARRHANRYHILGATSAAPIPSSGEEEADDDDEADIPEETESFISYLIEALQHKDTVVRYSAAKGLARLCDRLPTSFLAQVINAIISLFHINVPDFSTGAKDLSTVSENTWQGACMALAELSRRGLLFGETLGEALPWILRALLFDVRRGAHSVGANVRDAACYVVWALARSNDVESIRPHALELAERLVAVATLDRDVSIRRAASAAFQESVGRLGLFPHGIDVIRMTDFYAVSVRRSAFLECAVNVASLKEYRGYLLDHLIEIVTVHWDPAMRKLGSQSVALIAMHDPERLLGSITDRLSKRIGTTDNAVLHGTLLTLAEVCRLSRTLSSDQAAYGDDVRARCFALLDNVRPNVFRSLGAASILSAACQLIGSSFLPSTTSSPSETQTWETILNLALARQEELVHTAAADTISLLSGRVDISSKIRSTLDGWSSLTIAQQQSNVRLLGAVNFRYHSASFGPVMDHLFALTRPPTKAVPNPSYSANIEVRRNASDSITRSLVSLGDKFETICTPHLQTRVLRSLLLGLDDYSTDQRGDVGSWVRLSSVSGLRDVLILCREGGRVGKGELDDAVGGLWKQAGERIDHMRCAAGMAALAVYRAYEREHVRPDGYDMVEAAYGPVASWDHDVLQIFKNPQKSFAAITNLVPITPYRIPILHGLILSVGSKSDLGERIIGPALATLTTYSLPLLLSDIFSIAKSHFGQNRLFIPCIHTISLLLENGASHPNMLPPLANFVKMLLSNIAQVKSLPRLVAAATLCPNVLLAITTNPGGEGGKKGVLDLVVKGLRVFLTHEFPTVRTKCAEQLYAVLSSSLAVEQAEEGDEDQAARMEDWEQLEMVLLDTKWDSTIDKFDQQVDIIVKRLPRLLL